MKNYKQKDLVNLAELTEIAQTIVEKTIKEQKITDYGICVLGAGIKINYIAPRCRNPRDLTIVHQPFQGNVSTYKALKPALEYLQSKGVDCFYDDGRMD